MRCRWFAAAIAAASFDVGQARAQRAAAPVTHTVELAQTKLTFRAGASRIPIKDKDGRVDAEAGIVSFLRDGGDAASRPVTFVVGGGPGTSSAYLNLGALGPWRIDFDGAPSTPRVLKPNTETWLGLTDLVFVDPPGIGQGRLLSNSKATRERLWSVSGDVNALAAVIASWLHANGRAASPKVLLGQSYGGFRAPRLAEALQVRHGVALNGLILVSPVLDYGWRYHARTSPLSFAALLPSFAAARLEAEGRLSADALAGAEAYARGAFITDFLRGPADREAVDRMIARITALTSLPAELVRATRGRIDEHTFEREAARASGRISSTYDATITSPDPDPTAPRPDIADPVLAGLKAPLNVAMTEMLRTKLGQGTATPFNVASDPMFDSWDWDSQHGLPESVTALRKMLALDSKLRVLVAHGYTDLQAPYFESALILDQLPNLSDKNTGEKERVLRRTYPGGHMFYNRAGSRAAFHADAGIFYRSLNGAR